MKSPIELWVGGTKIALSIVALPIQFRLCLNSPGCLFFLRWLYYLGSRDDNLENLTSQSLEPHS